MQGGDAWCCCQTCGGSCVCYDQDALCVHSRPLRCFSWLRFLRRTHQAPGLECMSGLWQAALLWDLICRSCSCSCMDNAGGALRMCLTGTPGGVALRCKIWFCVHKAQQMLPQTAQQPTAHRDSNLQADLIPPGRVAFCQNSGQLSSCA